jgi:hypothetical protein
MLNQKLVTKIEQQFKKHRESESGYLNRYSIWITGYLKEAQEYVCLAAVNRETPRGENVVFALSFNGYDPQNPVPKDFSDYLAMRKRPLSWSRSTSCEYAFGPQSLEWAKFLLSDTGPFQKLLPFMDERSRDPEYVNKGNGFIFPNFRAVPFLLFKSFGITARQCAEYFGVDFKWRYLVSQGIKPSLAYILACGFSPKTDNPKNWVPNGIGGHQPFTSGVTNRYKRWCSADPDLTVCGNSDSMIWGPKDKSVFGGYDDNQVDYVREGLPLDQLVAESERKALS